MQKPSAYQSIITSDLSDDNEDSIHVRQEIITYIAQDVLKIEIQAKTLYEAINKRKTVTSSSMELESMEAINDYASQADSISRDLLELKQRAIQTTNVLLDQTPQHLHRQVKDDLLSYINGGTRVVTLLNNVYDSMRTTRLVNKSEAANNKNKIWVPPSSFERSTHKYWVSPNTITDVMLKCIEEVPILMYGKDKRHMDDLNNLTQAQEDIWHTIATSITSVYFDSPLSMVMYKDRIARIESAQLFRIRWYGEKKPSGKDVLFLELKTHHESWVQHKSVKERVAVRVKDMHHVLSRDINSQWSKKQAQLIILDVKPNLSGKGLEDAIDLLLRMRCLILKKNLQPCVRSSYRRVAFQSNTNNDLRFTIDRNIELSSEADAPLGSWCRLSDDNVKSVMMPVAVFEVKLGGVTAPDWVSTLLDNEIIEDKPKFSKYLSGASMLFEEYVLTLPYWADSELFSQYYNSVPRKEQSMYDDTTKAESEGFIDKSFELSNNHQGNFQNNKNDIRKQLNCCPALQTKSKNISKKQRVRIEPKTYFAAERTFIQWISAALLLITVAALLFSIADQYGDIGTRTNGVILIFIAMFIAVYALGLYFRRLYLLQNIKPYGYKDHLAPVILTIAVLMGIGSIMYNTPSLGISQAPTILSESTGGGECRRLPYTGISLLEYQPSDIVIDRTRDIAIVPSNHQITAIKLSSGDDHPVHPVHVVSEVAGSDFEGIVSVGDVLYAVSENSMLYAFEWEEEGRLETIGSWQLDGTVKASEGIAHRSDNDGNEQLLISSFDDLTQVSLIHVFDVPSSSSPSKLSPLYHLNDKLMGDGLLNAKIGAVQVFEDALYVLYDNARAIRVFDLTTGAMTSEMTLPRVGRSNGAFDKQFEGMFLERRVHASSLSSSLLRGSSNGDNNDQILLHLALDTPPEIWTFVMKEEEDNEASGTMYSFPQCAAAE